MILRTGIRAGARALRPPVGLAFGLLACLCGCPQAPSPQGVAPAPASAVPAPKLVQSGLEIKLADQLQFAYIGPSPANLFSLDGSTTAAMTSGWHPIETDGSGRPFAWTSGRNAVFEIQRASLRDMDLRVTLERHHYPPPAPKFTVTFAWNGQELKTLEFGGLRHAVDLAVPANRQRIGPNRLEIMPNYWFTPANVGIGKDQRMLGVKCVGIQERTAGTPDPEPEPVALSGEDLVQSAGSVATFYFMVPNGGRLVGELSRESPGGADGGRSRAILAITGTDGKQAIELETEAAPSEAAAPIPINIDLAERAGQAIAVSLLCSSAGGPPSDVKAHWRGLRIEGVRSALDTTQSPIPRKKYNVVIALFDALRADYTEPYGAAKGQTPTMSSLAAEGGTFLNAFTTASWTTPSVGSLLTSRSPAALGLDEFFASLGTQFATLPELLKKEGYRTAAVVDAPFISAKTRFDRGFDQFRSVVLSDERLKSSWDKPEQAARYLWDENIAPAIHSPEGEPFFLYLHFQDPHSPYEPMPPFDTMYEPNYRGRLDGLSHLQTAAALFSRGSSWLGPADLRYLTALYRGELTCVDRIFGLLLAELEKAGKLDETLVLVTADHGEEFREHGAFFHGPALYDEVLRIPLILRLPGAIPAGKRPQYPATHLDIAPTILDLIGAEIPSELEGTSLLAALGAPEDYTEPRLSASMTSGRPDRRSIRSGRWKLIVSREKGLESCELYDIEADPREELNLWPNEPILGHALRQQLHDHFKKAAMGAAADSAKPDPAEMDSETIERLRALGYLQ